MLEEVTILEGSEPGPTSVILVGIHGNEKHGPIAASKVIPTLKVKRGKVLFVVGNPRALELGVRETDANLNRMFTDDENLTEAQRSSYEYERAQYLRQYIDQADYLMDVHGSRSPKSEPFIICTKQAEEVILPLPITRVVSGFDKEVGATEDYVNARGKIGITIECGYIEDPSCVDVAINCINSFLGAIGHIHYIAPPQEHEYMHMYWLYHTQTDSFVLTKEFDDFEFVPRGTVIGHDSGEPIAAEKDSYIVFARNQQKVGYEGFLLGEITDGLV